MSAIRYYEIRNADDDRLATLTTDRDVVCRDDRAAGEAWVWEADSIGRRLPRGAFALVGVDPLLERPLVLVTLGLDGREVHRAEVPEEGEPLESAVLMPEDDE